MSSLCSGIVETKRTEKSGGERTQAASHDLLRKRMERKERRYQRRTGAASCLTRPPAEAHNGKRDVRGIL